MFEHFRAKFKKIPKHIWILLAIMLAGIFLRAYHFHDWLLFGPDQARDATIISDAIEGKSGPILLGAQAGNTQFYLGPIYYQLGYLSALIFGGSPDKLAYPDLLFSILTIPALFFLLKKYFSSGISLSLSALFSIAYFSIYTARFAVNSNLLSFFIIIFLYGLLEMMEEKNKQRYIWAIIVGISLGIGIQLHALSFLAMPVVAVAACIYLIKNKNLAWKNFLLVISFFLLMNFGQLIYEVRAGGSNFKHFLKGASSESAGLNENLAENVFLTTLCQARSSINQIFSLSDTKYCARGLNLEKKIINYQKISSLWFIVKILAGILFALGGYWLWFSNFFDKKLELHKKRFLALLMFFNLVFLGLFVSVVSQAEVHYFNFIFFVSFVFLGLWINLINNTNWKAEIKKIIFVLLAVALLCFNFYSLGRDAREYASGQASNSEISILGEIIPAANYILENSRGSNKVYLDGDRASLHRFSGALGYLMSESGVKIARLNEKSKNEIDSNVPLFYVKLIDNDSRENAGIDAIGGKKVGNYKIFGNIIIYSLWE